MNRNYNPKMTDIAFKLLRSPVTRQALSSLDTDTFKNFDDIVDALEEGPDEVSDRDTLRIELHHSNLPALVDAGFLEQKRNHEDAGEGELYRLAAPFEDSSVPVYLNMVGNENADHIFDAFASEDRRLVLSYLSEHEAEVSVQNLGSYIQENSRGLNSRSFKEIYTSLRHRNLPKLDEYEFIDYESEQDIVRSDDMLQDVDVQKLIGILYDENDLSPD